MIFGPALLPKVLDGTKTMTRRRAYWSGIAPIRSRYHGGKTYAVQPGRGQKSVARVLVTSVRGPERMDAMTADDARREGFPNVDAFFDYWVKLYGRPSDPQDLFERLVWVISFELVKEPTDG